MKNLIYLVYFLISNLKAQVYFDKDIKVQLNPTITTINIHTTEGEALTITNDNNLTLLPYKINRGQYYFSYMKNGKHLPGIYKVHIKDIEQHIIHPKTKVPKLSSVVIGADSALKVAEPAVPLDCDPIKRSLAVGFEPEEEKIEKPKKETYYFDRCNEENDYAENGYIRSYMLSKDLIEEDGLLNNQYGTLGDLLKSDLAKCVYSGMKRAYTYKNPKGVQGFYVCPTLKSQLKDIKRYNSPPCTSQNQVAATALEIAAMAKCTGIPIGTFLSFFHHESLLQSTLSGSGGDGGLGQHTWRFLYEANKKNFDDYKSYLSLKKGCSYIKSIPKLDNYRDTCPRLRSPQNPRRNIYYTAIELLSIKQTLKDYFESRINNHNNRVKYEKKGKMINKEALYQKLSYLLYNNGTGISKPSIRTLLKNKDFDWNVGAQGIADKIAEYNANPAISGKKLRGVKSYHNKVTGDVVHLNEKADHRCDLL